MTTASVNTEALRDAINDVLLHGKIALDLLTEAGAMPGTLLSECNERVNKAVRELERSLDTMCALQAGRVHG